MKPGPAAITDLILSELPIDAPPEPLESVITRIIARHPEWGHIPEEKASLLAPHVLNRLAKHWRHCIEEGK
jgi:hypothetical protein